MERRNFRFFALACAGLLSTMSLSGCWLVAAGAGAEAGYVASQDKRTAAETVEDQAIVASIKTKFAADSDVPALDVNIDSMKGHVTLRGAMRNQQAINRAIDIASRTEGVKSVTSKLVLVN